MICPRCQTPAAPDASTCSRCGDPFARARGDAATAEVAAAKEQILGGQWRLEQKLGEGGMGAVYLAHDLQLDRKVAIKLLSEKFVDEQELVARFEREARMTASLEHPNIVPVYAVGRTGKRPFIVMKKLEGMTLAEHLRHHGTLVDDDLLYVMRQLCSGLDFIHARGFVHRDIKSQNIFIGSDGHATILDFGILHSRKATEKMTRVGMVMGTPEYMSPEQALGKEIDHRADLYALAIILFECITGELPFTGGSDLQLIQMQAHEMPPELLTRAPRAPALMGEVMKRALSKLPERRYGSAGELYRAVEHAYTQRSPIPLTEPVALPTAAGRPVPISRAVPVLPAPSRRNRRRLAIALGLATVLLGGASAVLFGRGGQSEAAVPETAALRPTDRQPPPVEATPPATTRTAEAVPATATPSEPPKERVDPEPRRRTRVSRKPGQLNVLTTVKGEPFWATVFVNGSRKGNTPVALQLPPGTHKVRLQRKGYTAVNREVRIASGEKTLLRVELDP